jgi:hypothetical protein
VDRIGNPHCGKLAGPVQPGQGDRVPTVGLDALARSLRDQSWGNHHAVMAQISDLATQFITGRAGFKADMQPIVSGRQFLDHSLDRRRAVLDLAEKSHLSPPAAFGHRYGVLPLRNIESHEGFAILSHGPLPVCEARLGLPEHPSFSIARRRGPPASHREHDV